MAPTINMPRALAGNLTLAAAIAEIRRPRIANRPAATVRHIEVGDRDRIDGNGFVEWWRQVWENGGGRKNER